MHTGLFGRECRHFTYLNNDTTYTELTLTLDVDFTYVNNDTTYTELTLTLDAD